jgi:hypothetical protein
MNLKSFISNFHQRLLLLNLQNEQHIIMSDLNEYVSKPVHKEFEIQGYKRLIYENITPENTLLDCIFVENVITT